MNTALTEAQIKELEAKGFVRWTKGDYDRLYVDMRTLGFDYGARRFGESSLTAKQAAQLKDSKAWIDVKTGEICCKTSGPHITENDIKHAVEKHIAETPADKTLIGSAKQVEWAERVRTSMVDVYEHVLNDLHNSPKAPPENIELVEKWMVALKECRYASPIISLFGDVNFDKGYQKAFMRIAAVYRGRTPETRSQAILLCREDDN